MLKSRAYFWHKDILGVLSIKIALSCGIRLVGMASALQAEIRSVRDRHIAPKQLNPIEVTLGVFGLSMKAQRLDDV